MVIQHQERRICVCKPVRMRVYSADFFIGNINTNIFHHYFYVYVSLIRMFTCVSRGAHEPTKRQRDREKGVNISKENELLLFAI